MSQKSQGRPVDPTSERSLKPWLKLGMSRATFYWRKRYDDLPKRRRRRAAPSFTRELTINDI